VGLGLSYDSGGNFSAIGRAFRHLTSETAKLHESQHVVLVLGISRSALAVYKSY